MSEGGTWVPGIANRRSFDFAQDDICLKIGGGGEPQVPSASSGQALRLALLAQDDGGLRERLIRDLNMKN
jgi:hypothetical protein